LSERSKKGEFVFLFKKKYQVFLLKMYTVVPNIRQPTTCEELGETQSYIDDMDYLLAGFQADKILSSRCLR
jgi:hypothetical protein